MSKQRFVKNGTKLVQKNMVAQNRCIKPVNRDMNVIIKPVYLFIASKRTYTVLKLLNKIISWIRTRAYIYRYLFIPKITVAKNFSDFLNVKNGFSLNLKLLRSRSHIRARKQMKSMLAVVQSAFIKSCTVLGNCLRLNKEWRDKPPLEKKLLASVAVRRRCAETKRVHSMARG